MSLETGKKKKLIKMKGTKRESSRMFGIGQDFLEVTVRIVARSQARLFRTIWKYRSNCAQISTVNGRDDQVS